MPMANNHSCPPRSATLMPPGHLMLTTHQAGLMPESFPAPRPLTRVPHQPHHCPPHGPPGTSSPISPRRGFGPVPLLPKDTILSSVS